MPAVLEARTRYQDLNPKACVVDSANISCSNVLFSLLPSRLSRSSVGISETDMVPGVEGQLGALPDVLNEMKQIYSSRDCSEIRCQNCLETLYVNGDHYLAKRHDVMDTLIQSSLMLSEGRRSQVVGGASTFGLVLPG